MSERSFKRDRARAEAAARRREGRRARRATLATGAAIGATVVFAPTASAAPFEVDTLDDTPPDGCAVGDCTLREAVDDADSNAEADTITFADGLSGTIRLDGTLGQINVSSSEGIEIIGTEAVTISGDSDNSGGPNAGDTRIFSLDPYASLSLTGVDLTEGSTEEGNKYQSSGGAIRAGYDAQLDVTNSTITDSYAELQGGGIYSLGGEVTITNSLVAGNGAPLGGGIASTGFKYEGPPDAGQAAGDAGPSDGSLVITGSDLVDNEAFAGGGVFSAGPKYEEEVDSSQVTMSIAASSITGNGAAIGGGTFSKYSDTTVADSTVDENDAGAGGGLMSSASPLTVRNTELSGNLADGPGGAITVAKYGTLDLAGSQVTGNEAGYGGGIELSGYVDEEAPFSGGTPGPSTITNTTIAGNTAEGSGGGVVVSDLGAGTSVRIEATTISGNEVTGENGYGGGLYVGGYIAGDFELSNSTVSGNSATLGGGIAFDEPYQAEEPPPDAGAGNEIVPGGSAEFNNSTIADNTAATAGGGIYLGIYYEGPPPPDAGQADVSATVPLSSTIVADNTAGGAANDLAQATQVDEPGAFRLTNSLIEAPGTAVVNQNPAGSSILGADPQLGPLAGNGGPTQTHLPAATSPVIDTGLANGLTTDQRGLPRTVESSVPNGAGDGTDIGSVEVQDPPRGNTRALRRDEVPGACPVPFDEAQLALAGDDTSQTIEGSPGDDILRGFGGDDNVLGVGGDDCLTGDNDNDVVTGGDGDDWGEGGSGEDLLKGNGGDDEMRGADDDDKVKLGGGDDKGVGGGGEDRVAGAGGDDAVRGRFGADKVSGDNGDDAVRGGGGNDKVSGGSGANSLRGGGGDDVIVIAKGSTNEVNCGKGDDVVKGAGPKDEIAGNCETVK